MGLTQNFLTYKRSLAKVYAETWDVKCMFDTQLKVIGSVPNFSTGYDDWGRTTTKDALGAFEEYLYFAGSKLKTYKLNTATVANYNYDGFGKRRNKSDGTNVTWWRYDLGWNAIVEYDDADTDWAVETRAVSHTYTHGQVGQALGQSAGANPSSGAHGSYMQDHLGSTRGMLDDNDARVARVEYDPYGTMAVALGDVPGVLFTGKPWDEDVRMYAFPYRYYSPDFSRWLTRDPLGMVDGPNMYAYVIGNPVNRVDPLGLVSMCELACVAGYSACLVVAAFFCRTLALGCPATGPFALLCAALVMAACSAATQACRSAYVTCIEGCNKVPLPKPKEECPPPQPKPKPTPYPIPV